MVCGAFIIQPLDQSEYTVKSTPYFIRKINEINVPDGYSLVSFDVVSRLFTKVPLDKTINIILQRIYNNEIDTNIKRNDLKHIFLLCTKKRTFHLQKRKIYTNRWSTMGSPLGSVLADIHMGQLERTLLPALIEHVQD